MKVSSKSGMALNWSMKRVSCSDKEMIYFAVPITADPCKGQISYPQSGNVQPTEKKRRKKIPGTSCNVMSSNR